MALSTEGPIEGKAAAAVLFLAAANITFQAYGTLNSSPWTTENVGADPAKVASMKGYVAQAVISSMAAAAVSAVIGDSAWPLIGAGLANAYLVAIYWRAAAKGSASGSKGEGWFGTWGEGS